MKVYRNRRELKYIVYVVAIFVTYQFINYFVQNNNNKNSIQEDAKSGKIIQQFTEKPDEVTELIQIDFDEKISYEDQKFIEYEERRKGPGEHGEPYILTNAKEIEENDMWLKKEGFSVIVSDKISVDRVIPDIRVPAYVNLESKPPNT